MEQPTRKWVLVYKGRPGDEWVPWAVFAGIPRELRAPDVLEALEAWSRWPQWQARQAIGGQLRIRLHHVDERELLNGPPVYHWDDIQPVERKVSIPLAGDLHALCTRRARARGQALAEWARDALAAAAEAQQ